jgi:hypothetical protein
MIIEAIDAYLKTRPKDPRPQNCFHPSSLHKSARELYHHYLEGGNGEEFEPRILRVFDNGHAVHARLQAYLKAAGMLREAEVSVTNDEYEIKGHADGIIQVNGTTGILEIKSMNRNQFQLTFEPKPDHLVQVNVYMFCTGIPRACLLYECKDNQEMKEFYLKQDDTVLVPILEKIRYVQSCLRENKEPVE